MVVSEKRRILARQPIWALETYLPCALGARLFVLKFREPGHWSWHALQLSHRRCGDDAVVAADPVGRGPRVEDRIVRFTRFLMLGIQSRCKAVPWARQDNDVYTTVGRVIHVVRFRGDARLFRCNSFDCQNWPVESTNSVATPTQSARSLGTTPGMVRFRSCGWRRHRRGAGGESRTATVRRCSSRACGRDVRVHASRKRHAGFPCWIG